MKRFITLLCIVSCCFASVILYQNFADSVEYVDPDHATPALNVETPSEEEPSSVEPPESPAVEESDPWPRHEPESKNDFIIKYYDSNYYYPQESTSLCCDRRVFKVMPYGFYSWGKSLGICDSYGSVGAMISACTRSPCKALVGDLRFHIDDERRCGASGGIGLRIGDECCYDGYFVYFDYFEGCVGPFHQLGFSYERIQECYEFRLNTYIPLNTKGKQKLMAVFDDYDNTGVSVPYIAKAFTKERPYTGLDAEVGCRCCEGCFSGYAGFGLHYFARDCCEELFGMKGVLRFWCGDYLSFEGQITWDKCNKTLGRGQITLTLPFEVICSACGFSTYCSRPIRRVYRDGPIHLDRFCHYHTNY